MMERQKFSGFFSDENKTLFYFFLILIVLWLIFDILKYSWSDDPFQKVVLAPVGEEAFKIVFSLFPSFFLGYYFSCLPQEISKKSVIKFDFENIVLLSLIPFAIISGIVVGKNEGPMNNILLHFSTSTLAALLIFVFYRKIRTKDWTNLKKVIILFSSMLLPMFFHSLSNQYANLTVANNKPEFEYLVIIGRFLQDNTFLTTQSQFVLWFFISVYLGLFLWIIIYGIVPFLRKGKPN